mgnify:CR=1 FL=1
MSSGTGEKVAVADLGFLPGQVLPHHRAEDPKQPPDTRHHRHFVRFPAVTQLPVIEAGETAPLPTAKGMLEMKPLNGAPGAVQVVVVMAAVPLPDPGAAIETPMARLPVLPMVDPPVAVTVPPAAGEYANCGGTGAAIGIE